MKTGDMTDGIFLMHIVDALKETIEFTNGVETTEFLESKLLVRAVTSSFEIAGEATKNLTMEFRDAHPEVKWREMAGFRDVLIHQYFGIDLPNVWEVVANFIPETLPKLKELDEVAYVRFASIYREFKDVNTFMSEIKKILEK